MAVPKKKTTKGKRDQRRKNSWKVKLPEMTTCPECGATIAPYTACSSCGKYKGRQVVTIKTKVKEEEAAE
jgi:large subunit ribosomal protein L32